MLLYVVLKKFNSEESIQEWNHNSRNKIKHKLRWSKKDTYSKQTYKNGADWLVIGRDIKR